MRASLYLLALIAASSPSAWATDLQTEPQVACYEAEGFSTQEAWATQLRDWKAHGPPFPGPISAWKGYETAKREWDFARRHFRSDKQQHCYIGCRIAQDVDFETANYAGWEKERRDLTDCDPNTRFEILDYSATIAGGQIGATQPSAADCIRECEKAFDPQIF